MRATSTIIGLTLLFAVTAFAHAEPAKTVKKPPIAVKAQGFTGGKQCVVASYVHAESADADDRLILHVGTKAAISHLPKPCPGLMAINKMGELGLMPKKGRYCAGDSFTAGGGPFGMIGMDHGTERCTLGPFEMVAEKTLAAEYRR